MEGWNLEDVTAEFGEYILSPVQGRCEELISYAMEIARQSEHTYTGRMQTVRLVLKEKLGIQGIPFKAYRREKK